MDVFLYFLTSLLFKYGLKKLSLRFLKRSNIAQKVPLFIVGSSKTIVGTVRRLTILNHDSNKDLLLLIYWIEQCWRATRTVYEVLRESGAIL